MMTTYRINYFGMAVAAVLAEHGLSTASWSWPGDQEPIDELFIRDKRGRWVRHDLLSATAPIALRTGLPS